MRIIVVDQEEAHITRFYIEHLKKMGYSLTLLTEFRSAILKSEFDKIISIRFSNWPSIAKELLKEHKISPFDGVFSFVENATPLVNRISKLLNLKPISHYHSDSFRHKDRMRIAMEAYGVKVPRYMIMNKRQDMYNLIDFKFPIVLKPTSYSGSHGVVKVNKFEELNEKINIPFNAVRDIGFYGEIITLEEMYGITNAVIAEEFIGGEEYSVDGVSVNGKYQMFGIVKKFTTDEPYFYEIAHIFPAEGLDHERILSELSKAHKALGIENAYTHTEFKISNGDVYIIELAARVSGDWIPVLMNNVLDVNAVDCAIKCRTKELSIDDIQDIKKKNKYCGIYFYNAPLGSHGRQLSIFKYNGDLSKVIEFTNYYKDRRIDIVEGWYKLRIGHIMFMANSYDEAVEIIKKIPNETIIEY